MTNNERRLAAESKIRYYYRRMKECTSREGRYMWAENLIGALEIYKIMAEDGRTDREVIDDIIKAI